MIIHKSTVKIDQLKDKMVTPVGNRQRSNVIELVHFEKLSESDVTYLRSVQFNVSAGFVPQGFNERVKSIYNACLRGEYHQILIRIPQELTLTDLINNDKVLLAEGDIIEWTPASYIKLITALRAIVKEPE